MAATKQSRSSTNTALSCIPATATRMTKKKNTGIGMTIKIGYSGKDLSEMNHQAIELLRDIRTEYESGSDM